MNVIIQSKGGSTLYDDFVFYNHRFSIVEPLVSIARGNPGYYIIRRIE